AGGRGMPRRSCPVSRFSRRARTYRECCSAGVASPASPKARSAPPQPARVSSAPAESTTPARRVPRGTSLSIRQDRLSCGFGHDIEKGFFQGVAAANEFLNADAVASQPVDAPIDRRLVGNLQHNEETVLTQGLHRSDLLEPERLAN